MGGGGSNYLLAAGINTRQKSAKVVSVVVCVRVCVWGGGGERGGGWRNDELTDTALVERVAFFFWLISA